jgi:hypothetical protein
MMPQKAIEVLENPSHFFSWVLVCKGDMHPVSSYTLTRFKQGVSVELFVIAVDRGLHPGTS